jgi:hypothetical protein
MDPAAATVTHHPSPGGIGTTPPHRAPGANAVGPQAIPTAGTTETGVINDAADSPGNPAFAAVRQPATRTQPHVNAANSVPSTWHIFNVPNAPRPGRRRHLHSSKAGCQCSNFVWSGVNARCSGRCKWRRQPAIDW